MSTVKTPGQSWYDRISKEKALRNGAVIRFLKSHPLSTSAEIFAATGHGPIGVKYVSWVRYHGNVCYRLNRSRMRKDGLL